MFSIVMVVEGGCRTYVELVDGDADASLCSATSQANEVQAADVTGEQRGAKLQPTSGVRRCMLITMHVSERRQRVKDTVNNITFNSNSDALESSLLLTCVYM